MTRLAHVLRSTRTMDRYDASTGVRQHFTVGLGMAPVACEC
jgi:hypothetical protein